MSANLIDSFLQACDLADFQNFNGERFIHIAEKRLRSLLGRRETDEVGYINAVYQLMLSFPYRYAPANLRATEVLAQGCGMCTNKAVATVALLRFAKIRAGFLVLKYRNAAHCEKLNEPKLAAKIKQITIHVAPVVWFHQRWVPIDASDDPETARIIHEYDPPVEWQGQDILCLDVDEIELNLGVWPQITSLVQKQKWAASDFQQLNDALEARLNVR